MHAMIPFGLNLIGHIKLLEKFRHGNADRTDPATKVYVFICRSYHFDGSLGARTIPVPSLTIREDFGKSGFSLTYHFSY